MRDANDQLDTDVLDARAADHVKRAVYAQVAQELSRTARNPDGVPRRDFTSGERHGQRGDHRDRGRPELRRPSSGRRAAGRRSSRSTRRSRPASGRRSPTPVPRPRDAAPLALGRPRRSSPTAERGSALPRRGCVEIGPPTQAAKRRAALGNINVNTDRIGVNSPGASGLPAARAASRTPPADERQSAPPDGAARRDGGAQARPPPSVYGRARVAPDAKRSGRARRGRARPAPRRRP